MDQLSYNHSLNHNLSMHVKHIKEIDRCYWTRCVGDKGLITPHVDPHLLFSYATMEYLELNFAFNFLWFIDGIFETLVFPALGLESMIEGVNLIVEEFVGSWVDEAWTGYYPNLLVWHILNKITVLIEFGKFPPLGTLLFKININRLCPSLVISEHKKCGIGFALGFCLNYKL